MRKIPTLQTIADLAGVSKNTVSCALRSNPRISEKTRQRIQKIAKEIGYRPNPMVSALMQSLHRTHPIAGTSNLAFIHCCSTSQGWRKVPHLRELFSGAKHRTEELGYKLDPVWAAEPGLTPERLTSILLHRSILGLLIAPSATHPQLLPIDWSRFASATMGFSLKTPALHRAATFFSHAIPLAVDRLTQQGQRRIGVVFSEISDQRVDHAWEAGWAIAQAKRRRDISLRVFRYKSSVPGRFLQWWRRELPDALVSDNINDLLALLKTERISAPDPSALVSLLGDNEDTQGAIIIRDWQAIGSAAAELVVSQLMCNERGIPKRPKTILVEGQWRQAHTVIR